MEECRKEEVSDRIFKRKLNSVITGLDELTSELKVSRDSLLKGGKIKFDTEGTVAELQSICKELKSARLEEFEESYPPNAGPVTPA